MRFLVICVSLAVALCGTSADHHDSETGVHLGDTDLLIEPEGKRCPVWAVSYNALWLNCSIRLNELDFSLGNAKLIPGYENGKVYLKLNQTSSIPEQMKYTLMVKRGNKEAGSLNISPRMVPKPTVLEELSRLGYGVRSGNVTVLNARTLYLPDFTYNGNAPDAFFWAGKGVPSSSGKIVPDENGSNNILGAYNKRSIILKLPSDMTVDDIDYLSVWCREYKHDFGHVKIPKEIMVPPPTYMPLVADYSQITISAIDGTELLKFDTLGQKDTDREDSGKASLEFAVYFTLLPALLLLLK